MCYLIEGKSDKNLVKAKNCLVENPTESHFLLKNLSTLIVKHLILQVKGGAQVVEVFDTLSGHLSKDKFLEFVLPCLQSIVSDFKEQLKTEKLGKIPIILFPKGSNHSLKKIAETGCDVISIDWNISPKTARESVGPDVTLMGNLDPEEMYKNEHELKTQIIKMVKEFEGHRYIANLGHGMRPDMTPEAVEVFVKTVHSVKFD